MKKNNFTSIENIINVAKKGGMFILVDDEKRENEGDLIISTSDSNSKNINFMAKYGRGLICLALDSAQAKKLNLSLMSPINQSRNKTAFTVSIEAKKGITTGISARDRAKTIKIASKKNVKKNEIVSPGHVFPIIAKDGGVLVRALTKTPPSFAIIGNTCPGETISFFFTFFLDAILIVFALSLADIPVVIPFLASIETVNAVLFLDWLIGDIKDKFNFLAWALSKARQIKPRPYLAIKLIFLELESDVEIIKSPSFSLFSSSTRMNMPPFLATLIIFSIEVKLFFFIKIISNVFRQDIYLNIN